MFGFHKKTKPKEEQKITSSGYDEKILVKTQISYKEYPLRFLQFSSDGTNLTLIAILEDNGRAERFVYPFFENDDDEFASMIEFTDEPVAKIITKCEEGEENYEKIILPRGYMFPAFK